MEIDEQAFFRCLPPALLFLLALDYPAQHDVGRSGRDTLASAVERRHRPRLGANSRDEGRTAIQFAQIAVARECLHYV